jgi:hypothetical protein
VQAIGTFRHWLRSYWDRVGSEMKENDGVIDVGPEYQRRTMLQYLDGASPSLAHMAKWLRLSPQEKMDHLKDAFPDTV